MKETKTTTAWENISNDFFWLVDPMVIQGLLTFLAAATAALVALHIARTIYPLQKNKDREIKIDEEKRLTYRTYLRGIDEFVNQRIVQTNEEKMRILISVKASLNEVLIFASKPTAEAMVRLFESATDLSNRLADQQKIEMIDMELIRSQVKAANVDFKLAINAARRELSEEPLAEVPQLIILSALPKLEKK